MVNNNINYKLASLTNICQKYTSSFKSYKGFLWMYEFDYLENGAQEYFKLNGGQKREVIQMNKDFSFIKIWDSMAEASKYYNTSPNNISDCARGRIRFSNGFRWIKKEDYDKGILTKYINEDKYKIIIQLTMDGDFVKKWYNYLDIEREFGFSHSDIAKCCKGKSKKAYDFKWMFEENYNLIA